MNYNAGFSCPHWSAGDYQDWLVCVCVRERERLIAAMVEVFTGRTLLNKDGDFVDPEEALRNKVVGIYFSAGWCPPCRDFTPILCDFYTELVDEGEPPAQFEIVFVSSDKSPDDMVEYYHDMHGDWLALPWTDDYKQ
ncbi:nucleoredoxin-like protein 2 isoform X1 [Acanthopagrus latus]|uniref:nucleoredoxin-like protein 2 isoform X1 n=1 Tax=Acanthopagrus latus TaxID=8177 RepID=UPI00187BCB63|nr:nucleoredoxin-like protein 2 isoform X1 [Acanthopagrus latus]